VEKGMAQDYDKIFKENIEEIILPLAEKLLGIVPEGLEEVSIDVQRTIERKPDFLKKVVHKDSTKDYILHIEFQLADEKDMVYRMLEYYAMLLRKQKIKVKIKQVLFFIGKGKAKMEKTIKHDTLDFSFEIINLQEINYRTFLSSQKPEEVILAILADFGKEDKDTVVKNILQRVKDTTQPNLKRQKTVKQLEILSTTRKLQKLIIKHLETMALTYDLKSDIRFKQGIEQGIEQGEGRKTIVAVKNLLSSALSYQQIADALEVSLAFVEKIAKEMKK
jgi:predicted transposase/invertase (TIGR01784 family)